MNLKKKRRENTLKKGTGNNSNAVKKIQRKFRTYKKKKEPVLNKEDCRKKFKQCINDNKTLEKKFVFSNSNDSNNSDNNNSFYEKLAKKNPRCKNMYKKCRGFSANYRTPSNPSFYNK
tara:strand:- start:66 stop:419 length:354 start_codon:yes stop_codon:yes gene_type:complete